MALYAQPKSCEDFYVAVICALPLEARAVIEQFDKAWDSNLLLSGPTSRDPNAYSYGTVGRHNVVVAHMPGMGKASAAGVATLIGISFPRIELALVVGICGGVPYSTSGKEIRLGDVIISEGLVQYDFRRQYPDKTIRKDAVLDSLSRPIPKLRALISKLKSGGKQLTTKTVQNLERVQLLSGRYRYPGVETDQLFGPDYRHKHHGLSACPICSKCVGNGDEVCQDALELSCLELGCDENMAILRQQSSKVVQTSLDHEPMIHYGLVASGDTVMKSGEDRDAIAKKDKVIAFDMEGAGVWEKLPCVVIKGVCDYADSHKNKTWQNYAAAASASCMKAFLEQWRPAERSAIPIIQPDTSTQVMECLRSLSFSNIDDRQASIALAHENTCNWLFETAQFQTWQSRHDIPSHNGVLWAKGRPGAGKSTLMKHLLLYCKENFTDHVIAAYFFNARGNVLEKTPLGMLRSLLYQLLVQDPSLCDRFLPMFFDKRKKLDKEWQWSMGELKTFLLSEIRRSRPDRKPLLLLIDALDECNESDVRDVVSFLESLSVSAVHSKASLKICLSSRYYPTIDMKVRMELKVEEQKGHDQDIAKYVHQKLRVQDEKIESELLRKSQHVFMWVVLVVEMVNKAYDDGNVRAMRKKLNEVPSDLDEVFSILLRGDQGNKQETILMLQWVLFTRRRLKPEELYFAVLSGIEGEELGPWDRLYVSPETIKRYITSTSRGLVEVRKEKYKPHGRTEYYEETVQFIHESVNDFLLRDGRLQTLDPQLTQHPVGSSHDRLASCCISYMMMKDLDPIAKDGFQIKRDFKKSVDLDYPFLEYATACLLYHANEAHNGGQTQEKLVRQLTIPGGKFHRLRNLQALVESEPYRRYAGEELLYAVALGGYSGLTQTILAEGVTNINAQGGYYGNALQAASFRGSLEIVELLLQNGADVNTQGGHHGNALQVASSRGSLEIVELLLQNGANVNTQGGFFGNALQAASFRGSLEIVELLLQNGANVNTQGGFFGNALQAASCRGSLEIVELLLQNGADVNAQGGYFGNALQAASFRGSLEIVELLLQNGADVNAQGGYFGNALQAALDMGQEDIAKLLRDAGSTPLPQAQQVVKTPARRKRKRRT